MIAPLTLNPNELKNVPLELMRSWLLVLSLFAWKPIPAPVYLEALKTNWTQINVNMPIQNRASL